MSKKVQKEESFFFEKVKNTWLSMQNHCAIKTLIWFSHFIRTYLIFAIVIICAYFVFDYYYDMFNRNPPSDKHEAWGQLGDYFGGILNPIVGLATIYLLSVSIRLQRNELKLTRKELSDSRDVQKIQVDILSKQAFEQSFFSRMSNYRQILNSVSFQEAKKIERDSTATLFAKVSTSMSSFANEKPTKITYIQYNGKDALAKLWSFESSSRNIYFDEEGEFYPDDILSSLNKKIGSESHPVEVQKFYERIKSNWDIFYKENRHHIDSLLKNLFSLINWVDQRSELNKQDRWQYLELILAQLTNLELDILFHYGLFSAQQEHLHAYEKIALLRDFDRMNTIAKFIDYSDNLPSHYEPITYDRDLAYTQYIK